MYCLNFSDHLTRSSRPRLGSFRNCGCLPLSRIFRQRSPAKDASRRRWVGIVRRLPVGQQHRGEEAGPRRHPEPSRRQRRTTPPDAPHSLPPAPRPSRPSTTTPATNRRRRRPDLSPPSSSFCSGYVFVYYFTS